jgi:hypothetical protein
MTLHWDGLKVGMKIFHVDATSRGLKIFLCIKKITSEYFDAFRILIDYEKMTIDDSFRVEKSIWRPYGYEIRGYSEVDNNWWFQRWVIDVFSNEHLIEYRRER